jgi:hypothetical protein
LREVHLRGASNGVAGYPQARERHGQALDSEIVTAIGRHLDVARRPYWPYCPYFGHDAAPDDIGCRGRNVAPRTADRRGRP